MEGPKCRLSRCVHIDMLSRRVTKNRVLRGPVQHHQWDQEVIIKVYSCSNFIKQVIIIKENPLEFLPGRFMSFSTIIIKLTDPPLILKMVQIVQPMKSPYLNLFGLFSTIDPLFTCIINGRRIIEMWWARCHCCKR